MGVTEIIIALLLIGMGIALTVIAWRVRAMMAGPTKECRHCAETIKAGAKVCRFCGRDV